jgi:uncharacterized damage-inducible protein DinB
MTWIVPEAVRIDEPFLAGERTMLEGWLDCHRTTLWFKCSGLTGTQLAEQAVPPANLSLLGLVRHMAEVERSWFRRRLRGEQVERLYFREGENPDACFEALDPANAREDFECLQAEWAAARNAASGMSLERAVNVPPMGEVSLRWIYIHMIEEYARHNGHADLLRQRIDGATGV